jgi:hypothetical protein
MKTANDLALIILIALGVICAAYWIKQVPTDAPNDVKACIEAREADFAGSPESRQDPVAWKKSIEAACKNQNN